MSSVGHGQTQCLILESSDMKQDIEGFKPTHVHNGIINDMASHIRCYNGDIISQYDTRRLVVVDNIVSLHNTRRIIYRG